MDAVIRYCFKIEPEMIEDFEQYAKLYSQGKFILDYTNILQTKRAADAMIQ